MPLSRAFLRRNPSRHNLPNLLIPPMVTMLVSGLWHGATPNLIVWGFLNGVYMITENAISLFKPVNPSKKVPLWRQISSMLFIIFLLVLSAVLFQLDLITSAAYFKGLFTWDTWALTDLRPLVFIALTLLLDIAQKRAGDEFSLFLKFPKWLRSPAIALAVFAIFVAHKLQSAPAPFIYP
jgi:D-alanyl-lipoteichoic acid acyltransferase DltB (MBOAT superfamily)